MRSTHQQQTLRKNVMIIVASAAVAVALLSLLVFINATAERQRLLNDYRARIDPQIDGRQRQLEEQIDLLRSDALFLSAVPPVGGIVRAAEGHGFDIPEKTPDTLWKHRLRVTFSAYMSANPRLSKLRFIGVADGGRELVRVDRVGNNIVAQPVSNLITRGNQDYFRAALRLHRGETYVSDLDLTREPSDTGVQNPPTMRAVTPVFGSNGRVFGAIVVNLDARPLLAALPANLFTKFTFYLTNSRGVYLIHPQAARTFHFDDAAQRWQSDFTSLPADKADVPQFDNYVNATGIVHARHRRVSLDARDPQRFLTITMTVSDAVVESEVVARSTWTALQLIAGAVIAGALILLYLALIRRATAQQRRLAAFVEGSSDAIIGKTLEGVVTDWNSAAARMFGYSSDEAIGQTLIGLIVPVEHQAEEAAILSRVARGEIVPHFHTRRRRRDGSVLDVSVTVSPVYARDGRIIGASKTARDISAQMAAEQNAADAQARLSLTTSLTGIALWEWNPLSGETTWDDTLVTLYGQRPETFAQSFASWQAAVHPDDLQAAEAALTSAVEGGAPYDTSFRIVTPAGEIRHIRAKGTITFDQVGRPVHMLGINFDITYEKARELRIAELNATLEQEVLARTAELRRISALQQAILTDAAFGIIATDVEGTITLFNPAAERMLGYTAAEVVGKVTPELIHDPAEIVARAAALTMELGMPVEPGFDVFTVKAKRGVPDANEWTYIRKDGTRFPILLSPTALLDADGNVFGYLGMIVDQTQRQLHDRALAESERFLQAVTDNIPSLVGYWDADLRCRFANEPYRRSLAALGRELEGARIGEVFAPDALAEIEPYIAGVRGGAVQKFERRRILADGRAEYTWSHYIPDLDGQTVRGFYVLVSDVTEVKKAEIRLKALNDVLRARTTEAEAATLSKSRFLANMSHEIRSPMNAILGMLQLLETTDLSPRQDDYTRKARAATKSLLHLLNDILDFSKIEAGKLAFENEPFALDAVVADIATLVSTSLESKPVEVRFAIDAALPSRLHGDPFRLRQVLLNLVGNAIKFTAEGTVTIGMQQVARSPKQCNIEFSVQDSGIGIAAEQLAAIFEGFTQAETSTTRRYGGTGLGLAISQRIVSLMGGQLDVESAEGVGSRFHFRLTFGCPEDRAETEMMPRVDGAQRGDSAGFQRPLRLRGLKVLVIDDLVINQQVAGELLSLEGADVEVASGGREAIDKVLDSKAAYDVILVDIQMPEMDGYETTRRLRRLPPATAIPIIAMTANAMKSDKLACRAAGMDDHIAKPIDIEVVVRTILGHSRPAGAPAPGPLEGVAMPQAPKPLIDLEPALGRLGNNGPLFANVAELFIADATPMTEKLRAALLAGDCSEAAHIAHSLKGMAGTVGNTSLSQTAARLEDQIRTHGHLDDPEAEVTQLAQLLVAGNEALEVIIARLREAAVAGDDSVAETDVQLLLAEIDALLEKSELRIQR